MIKRFLESKSEIEIKNNAQLILSEIGKISVKPAGKTEKDMDVLVNFLNDVIKNKNINE